MEYGEFYRSFDPIPYYRDRNWLIGTGSVGGKAKGLSFAHGRTFFSEDVAGHAEETGYLFCPLYNPMCFNGPLLTERFQPQAGVNRTLSGGVCIGIHFPKAKEE